MNELHLCIATGYNVANLIPLKQLKAQEVWILETPFMKAKNSSSDLKTALAPYTKQVTRFDFDDSTPQTIRQSALLITEKLDGRDVIFHITGGTKLMVLAIHEQLQLLASGSGSLRVVYADTTQQTLSWFDAEPRQEPMFDVLNLNDLLLIQGYRSSSDTRTEAVQQKAASRALVTREMGDNAGEYGRFFSVLATVAHRACNGGSLRQTFEFTPGGQPKKLLAIAAQNGLVEWHPGDPSIAFIDSNGAQYFAGGWIEEYVFLKMLGTFSSGQFAINSRVIQERTKTANEIDAIAIHKNRALIVECKTSHQIKAQDSIYKLGQIVRQVGGLMATGLYISAQDVGDADRERAKEYKVEVMAGDDLRKVSQFLRDWKNR